MQSSLSGVLCAAFISFAAGSACTPRFDSLEEACHDKVPGEGAGTPEAISALNRANCYRRYEQLPRLRLMANQQTAAQAHAAYLAANAVYADLDGEALTDLDKEEEGSTGFTGASPEDRLAVAGTPYGEELNMHWWSKSVPATGSGGSNIDAWMHDPHLRQAILQPNVWGAGWAEDGEWATLELHYGVPADDHESEPIIYPRDGQTGVPTSFVSPWPNVLDSGGDPVKDESLPEGEEVGYPITFTVGSTTDDDYQFFNHYRLQLNQVTLTGPDGEIADLLRIGPDQSAYGFFSTVGVASPEPLQPNTEYRVTAEISWTHISGVLIESTFTTGS